MEDHVISIPLEDFVYENTPQLFNCLWHCRVCDACQNQRQFQDLECLSTRIKRLGRYIEYYRQATTFYEPYEEPGVTSTLNDHRDLFMLIRRLKSKTHVPRNQLMIELFNRDRNASNALVQDQDRALKLAIRIVIMVDIGNRNQGIRTVKDKILPPRWSNDLTFTQYMAKLLPQTDHPTVNCDENRLSEELRVAIRRPNFKSV